MQLDFVEKIVLLDYYMNQYFYFLIYQISWIRRRDWHVLTSSIFTYTNDERFQVLHPEGSDDWTLQIKYVEEKDIGTYECQASFPHYFFDANS